MHDTLDERLARLGAELEDSVRIPPPRQIRTRGGAAKQERRRHGKFVLATATAVGVVAVGGLAAFQQVGGHQTPNVNPGANAVFSTATAPTASAAGTTGTTAATAASLVVVDLGQHEMTVYDRHGKAAKTLPVTGGKPSTPSHTGTFTITGKKQSTTLSSSSIGAPGFDTQISWVIQLDGGGPSLYAMPWNNSSRFGNDNVTYGDVGMSDASAQWLYDQVAVGDRVQIK